MFLIRFMLLIPLPAALFLELLLRAYRELNVRPMRETTYCHRPCTAVRSGSRLSKVRAAASGAETDKKRRSPLRAPSLFEVTPLKTSTSLGALAGGAAHGAGNLGKYLADVGRNARHDRARGDGHKAGHECVFDEVLTFGVLQNLK